jgi:hypothetical protein
MEMFFMSGACQGVVNFIVHLVSPSASGICLDKLLAFRGKSGDLPFAHECNPFFTGIFGRDTRYFVPGYYEFTPIFAPLMMLAGMVMTHRLGP